MKKIMLASILVFLCFASLAGAPVTEEVVLEVGYIWLSHAFPEQAAKEVEQIQLVEKEGLALYYILSLSGGGWVLVAADDASLPILGYSDSGDFEYPITCPTVVYWMSIYERQLETAIRDKHSNNETLTAWNEIRAGLFSRWDSTRDVAPLLQTTWNQDWPYNNSCPYDAGGPGSHAYAGCTATAMGQVMKYWNHPSAGSISHTYTHPTYGALSANFASTSYNWASMPNSISSLNTHIATLLYHCGVGVEMNYGPTASGALVFTNDAMETFFGYDPAAHWDYRSNYPTTWTSMMRADLDNGKPVIYNGYDTTLQFGHCFVMDGYRTTQSDFHFNFGWGGSYNGYFTLNNIIPYPGFDYSYGQWAYFNLSPGLNISGQVTDSWGSPISGVTVDFSNTRASVVTNSSGQYSKAVSNNYTGTATPSLAGYSFAPSNRNYSLITASQTNQNYTASQAVPADPSNAFATAMAYDTVQLNWTDNSSNETGFLIEARLMPDLTWYYRNTVPTDATVYVDFGLMPLQTYDYRVTAFNGAGNSNPAYAPPVTTLSPPPPTGLFEPTVNFTDAWLQWTEAGSAFIWDIEYGPPGFTLGTGIYLPMMPSNPFNLQGLAQGTTYDWYVRSFYPSVNVYSAWAGPGNFTTQGTPTLPYPWFENFEAGFVNMVSDPASNTPWALDTTLFSEGVQSAWNAYQASNANMLVTTYTFDLTTANFPLLYFDHIAKTENNWDHCYVEVSNDGGFTWMIFMPHEYFGGGAYVHPSNNNPEGPCFMESSYPEWGTTNIVPDNTWWKTEVFDLRAYLGQPNLMLRFRLKSDSSIQRYGWLIDNVKVQESPLYDYTVSVPLSGYLLAGSTLDYIVTVQNKGAMPDAYNAGIQGIGVLNYTLYEMDGVSLLQTPINIPPWTTYQFIMRVTDPAGFVHQAVDYEALDVTSVATGAGFSYLIGTTYLLGDTASNPIVINSLPYTDSFTTIHYNHDHGPYGDASGLANLLNPITGYYSGTLTLGSSKDVVYQLTLSQPTLLSIDLAGSSYDTALALVTAPGTNPADVLLIDDDGTTQVSYVDSGCNYVPAGTCYIVIGGFSANSGNCTLAVNSVPPPVQPTVTIQLDLTVPQLILSWTQNPDTRYSYDIYSDSNPYGSFANLVASNLNAGTYSISPIPSPMMYYKVVEKFCFPAHAKEAIIKADPFNQE